MNETSDLRGIIKKEFESSIHEDEAAEQEQESLWPVLPSEALYGLPGEIVKLIAPHTEADSVALLVQLLTGFGNLIGRGPHFRVEATQHYFKLFAVLVGETSRARKGTSWEHINRLLSAIDREWAESRIVSGLASGEGLIWAVRDPIEKLEAIKEKGRVVDYQTVIADSGIKDKRALVIQEEFSAVLRVIEREGSTLSATIRAAWDSGNLHILTKNSAAQATGSHISILGHITKEELLRCLNSTEAANGFANRFLWLAVRRSKPLPEGGTIEKEDFAPCLQRLTAAVDFARNAGELRRDTDARKAWATVYPILSEGKPGLLGAVTSRSEAQVLRLSCLYALMDCSHSVRVEHLQAALALWEYCEDSCRNIFGAATGDSVADKILDALRGNSEGMTRTEIREYFQRNVNSERISQALKILKRSGLAHSTNEDSNGGRPIERWFAGRGGTP